LRRWLKSIGETTMVVVAGGCAVGCSVTFSTGFDPDESVFEDVTGVGGWSNPKARVDHITPISPGKLAGRLHTVSGNISDEMSTTSH